MSNVGQRRLLESRKQNTNEPLFILQHAILVITLRAYSY